MCRFSGLNIKDGIVSFCRFHFQIDVTLLRSILKHTWELAYKNVHLGFILRTSIYTSAFLIGWNSDR